MSSHLQPVTITTAMKALKIEKTVRGMKKLRESLKETVGFVPTMGYLHDGHLSLVRQAKKENDHVVVSIFVNPTQFGPKEDFNTYPRSIKEDITLLQKASTDVVFLPDVSDLYPKGFETYVSLKNLSSKLEGEIRPGHFTGVATIVTMLFNIIQPTRAYFGQKDAQQVLVIKKMVENLHVPVDIMVGKTIREPDGLAMSSRNVFLSPTQRKQASILFKALLLANQLFESGENQSETIKEEMTRLINSTTGKIDYISIADTETLEELNTIKKSALVSLAVRFGKTRLIDNITLKK